MSETRPAAGRRPDLPAAEPRCGCGRADCRDALMTLATTTDPAARPALRDGIVAVHLGLAYRIAARYQRSGLGSEDVRQVAALALVEAVDRFDPRLGTVFSAFAAPTISGTIKRHFRDDRWMVRAPRPVKDLWLRIRASTDLLPQQLRRVPTVADLADHLGGSRRRSAKRCSRLTRFGRCRLTPRSGRPATTPRWRRLSAARTTRIRASTTWRRYARC
jgi:DNA-directed RNA polymerase sigma subunit (sigma70/sigma32)